MLGRTALHRQAARTLLRHHLENGLAVSAALAAVALGVDLWRGADAAVLASIGAMCVSIVDLPAPLASKLRMMSGALAGSTAVTLLAGLASAIPAAMAAVVVATSLALALATAFGRPAVTLAISGVLALVIGLALPTAAPAVALQRTALFLLGGACYLGIALAIAAATMDRERRMALNEAMISFAAYLRARSRIFDSGGDQDAALGGVIESHGAMIEALQNARQIIFGGARRPRWIGAMVALIDAYEAALAGDSDWDALRARVNSPVLRVLYEATRRLADDVDGIALALVAPLAVMPAGDYAGALRALDEAVGADTPAADAAAAAEAAPTRAKLAHLIERVANLAAAVAAADGTARLPAGVDVAAFLDRRPAALAILRSHASWSSSVTRYAVRLMLAMLSGYAVTLALPHDVHGGWVLLTIALIMRSSYAVTRQRRNDRLIGTLAGCALMALLLPLLPDRAIIAGVIVGVGVSHAYANVNYRITSFAASAAALMFLHFLEPDARFIAQRVLDTAIGAGISMAFAFVLPSWEWRDVPRLVDALIAADLRFARRALERAPAEQAYRIARKRALDAFTALATMTRRLSSEPKRHAGDLTALNGLLVANYLLASDLASVQSLLRTSQGRIDEPEAGPLLRAASERVAAALSGGVAAPETPLPTMRRRGWADSADARPVFYLRRRLGHIEISAARLAAEAARVRGSVRGPTGG
ncbi:MAG TPA: FUSC family membrane protein [Steroidobacteraceae bacterium]|nr:FUSC family membrane protein [Steroidobacteraceae bacterium]